MKMSVYDPTSTANVDYRRKWDREEYERKAQERLLAEKDDETKGKRKLPRFPDEPKVKRELLKAREYKVANLSC